MTNVIINIIFKIIGAIVVPGFIALVVMNMLGCN